MSARRCQRCGFDADAYGESMHEQYGEMVCWECFEAERKEHRAACQFCHQPIPPDDPPLGGAGAHAACYRRAAAADMDRRARSYRRANGIPDAGR